MRIHTSSVPWRMFKTLLSKAHRTNRRKASFSYIIALSIAEKLSPILVTIDWQTSTLICMFNFWDLLWSSSLLNPHSWSAKPTRAYGITHCKRIHSNFNTKDPIQTSFATEPFEVFETHLFDLDEFFRLAGFILFSLLSGHTCQEHLHQSKRIRSDEQHWHRANDGACKYKPYSVTIQSSHSILPFLCLSRLVCVMWLTTLSHFILFLSCSFCLSV